MYRPTVRMDDCFRDWIDQVKDVTGLDRNQIIRLAIYAAPFSDVFKQQINSRKQVDVSLPSPIWKGITDGGPWRNSTWNNKEREGDVKNEPHQRGTRTDQKSSHQVKRSAADVRGKNESAKRTERTIHQHKILKPGTSEKNRGIKINIG
ncbi:hypothetical protein ACM26V_00545 [Salipaludibacillus sp. HK11]|uniref:hypothetical protein n=1 Tax=Salipaludibacillus sp. HK11 TaxID=3394320 RepID=UPI0039FCE813